MSFLIMKTKLLVALLLLGFTVNAQLKVNIGTDTKILLFGTDNQYTKHEPKLNFEVKLEYFDYKNHYFALGYKYVDLEQPYNAYFVNIGKELKLSDKFSLIPNLELGLLMRDKQYNHSNLYPQLNTSLRYDLNWLEIGFKPYLQLARDLPNRNFRYGATTELIINLK